MKPQLHIHTELESELVLIGGEDRTDLQGKIEQLDEYLRRTPFPQLQNIAYTTGVAAREALCRAAIVANNCEDLGRKLKIVTRRLAAGKEQALPGKGVFLSTEQCPAPGRTVFMFPGEGSQYPDMLRELCLHFPACRGAFDDADTASAMAGSKLLPGQWIYSSGQQSRRYLEQHLGIADVVQAVLAANTALMRLFAQLGVTPDAILGVGIGEVTALECAGLFDFASREERLNALHEGYKLLAGIETHPRTPKAASLSVEGLTPERLGEIIAPFAKEVALAREHSDTLSGLVVRPEIADNVAAALKEAGGTVRMLPLTHPYHTPWMDHIKPHLTSFFKKYIKREASVPVYSCMLAAPHEGSRRHWAANAAAQWTRPLRFAETIRRLHEDGYRVFVELGARGSLTANIASILREQPHVALAANRGHRSDIQQIHQTLATLAAHGQNLDITPLHSNRGSQQVDLARPRPTQGPRSERLMPAATAVLPTLAGASLPAALIAAHPPKPAGLRPAAATPRQEMEGGTSFPLLLEGDQLALIPGESLELTLNLSIFDQPFLAESALGSPRISLSENTLRGLPLMPLGMLAELMAEAAQKLCPERCVVALEEFKSERRLTVEGSSQSIRITARRLTPEGGESLRFATAVYEQHESGENTPDHLVAGAVVVLASDYPEAPEPPTLALRSPMRLDWQSEDIYPLRLHYGQAFQNLHAIPQWGENGLQADLVVLPRNSLLRRTPTPRFALDPVVLVGAASALAAWAAREPGDGNLQLPQSCGRIDLYAPPLPEWSRIKLALAIREQHREHVTGDFELSDDKGNPLATIRGWRNRIYPLQAPLHKLLLNPVENYLTRVIPAKLMPNLSQEVVCSRADTFPDELLTPEDDFWLRATAHLTLSLTERLIWREMGGTQQRRREWLLGRIAAKDSVRHCLRTRYGRQWAAADIRIETGESGKPAPQGEWRRHCGARMDISITHTANSVVAAAAPNSCLGIDIEQRDRVISDDFAAAAFGTLEQEVAAESGEGATALFRFWCAKEALVKALGTGLRYGASDLLVRAYDRETGSLKVEATRLWAQAFPTLRNLPITVHSCLLDNLVLAVCLLDEALVNETRLTGK